jgi:hypothetical protein
VGAHVTVPTSARHWQEVKRVTDSSSEEKEEEHQQDQEQEEDIDGNHQKNGQDSGQGQNLGACGAVRLHPSTPSSHHQPASSTILLSPVSFQHSQLRTKSFPPPPLIRLPAAQPNIHPPLQTDRAIAHASDRAIAHASDRAIAHASDRAIAHASAADADCSSADDGGGAALPSSSTTRPTSPLTQALFSPQQPSRLIACIRQLKAELDCLRCTVDAYTTYLRRVEIQMERCVVPSLMPFFNYLTTAPPVATALPRRPSPETVPRHALPATLNERKLYITVFNLLHLITSPFSTCYICHCTGTRPSALTPRCRCSSSPSASPSSHPSPKTASSALPRLAPGPKACRSVF